MVEASRIYKDIFNKKPMLVLDNRFPIKNELKVGDKGQLAMDMTVDGVDLVNDQGTEYKITTLIVNEINKVNEKNSRI